jgi:3-hydroxy acid dehydrogenase / malonic semialdehyde reductase
VQKTVLITGATSGIGEACAIQFAANQYKLILNGRRLDRLEALKEKLVNKYGVTIISLPFDVRNRQHVFDAIESLPEDWKSIDILINNAGLALGRDSFENASLDDWDTMIDTNVKGLLYVSKAVTPLMIKQKSGHIINIGSIAGKEVYEKGNAYCASKHAVDALSKAMRIDLLQHHIKVTAIHPGAVETEFSIVRFKGDEASAKKVYEGYQPLTGEDVASVIYYTATLPPHVCINDLVLTPTRQADSYHFNKS